MRFGLLGTLYVESPDGVMVTLRGHLLRTLTALFVTRNGSVVTTDEIIDTLWRDGGSSINALHAQISKLRRTLSTSDDVHPLRTVDGGYVLEVVPDDIDVVRFERLARDGAAALLAGDHDAAVTALDDALGLWRGPALGEFTAADFAVLERHRLDELRAIAREHRIDALLVSRRHELVVPELEEAVTAEPLRERLWAQLMLALYRSGRQADALRAYNRARRALVEEVGVEPGAPLRDLEQRILTQDPGLELDTPTQPVRASVAGVSVAPTYVGNVKHELSSFVGRAAELATLRELVATRRLVSIVGPGGVGKTRLASELAGPREAAWNSGAWMLALDAVSGRDGVARALLTVFGGHADGASAAVDLRAAVTVAAAEIGDAAVLVVLDNCEHVLDDARTAVSELLARCPNLRILTTSRVVLDVTGETVRQLEPLPIEDAVALFVDRGVDAQQDLDVSTDDRAVRSICEHVDRLPLGIELAAARLRVFTPRQLDAQLADRLGSISATGSSRDARHRTLPATVGWSYDLLFGPEQAVLRALSVFRGTFALDAVEAVVVDEDITAPDVADILARLVDKSLVVAERGEREPRYRLLRTVSDFAAAAADAVGETAGLCRRHAEWVAQLAARGRNGLHGPDQATWVARLRDDLPNIETALSYARHRGDVDTGLRTCADLGWFALTTTWLPSALDDLLTLLGREGEPSAAGARALAWAAVLGAGLAEAPTMAAEAVGRARSLGDEHLLAETLIVTGMPMSRRLDTADQAVAHAREGRAAAAHAADAWLVAASFALEGGARALDSGGLGDAVDLLEQAGRGYAALGDHRSGEINAWYLSQAHEDCGQTDLAEAVLLPFTAGTIDSAGTILDIARLSWLAQRNGDGARAAALADRLTAATGMHHRRLFWGAAQFAIGHAALTAGDLGRARRALTDALTTHAEIGFERIVVLEHALLGDVAQREHRDAASIEHHDEALRRAEALTVPLPSIIALEVAAQSALRRGAAADAIALHTRAAELRTSAALPPTAHERAVGRELLHRARRASEVSDDASVPSARR